MMKKPQKKRKKNPTAKQKRLAKLISENVGSEHPLTMYEMMRRAGYTESTARKQIGIVDSDGLQVELKPVIDELIEHRRSILKRMRRTLGRAKYRDAVDGLDKVTKNIELLSGRATERIYNLTDEERADVDRIFGKK